MADIKTNVNSISISELRKSHRGVEILHGVGFTAAPGEVTAFLGPNGAGKSSTLRILLGLDRADSGSALFGGKRYRDIDRPLTRVGALFDGLAGNKMRSVASHLAIVAESNGIPRARVSQVLEEVGLSAKRKSRLGTLSLGEGQRLGLAVALLGEPQFLVLDEPTNGLDPAGIRWFRRWGARFCCRATRFPRCRRWPIARWSSPRAASCSTPPSRRRRKRSPRSKTFSSN